MEKDGDPEVPNPHNLLSSIPVDCQYFPVIDLCGASFSIPVETDNQKHCAFTRKMSNVLRLQCPRDIQSPTYFSQILKADLNSVNFPRDSTLI